MSKLSKLFGKPQEFEIGGEMFTIHPFTLSDMDLIMELQDDAKRLPATKKLVIKMIKQSVPDATEDEINRLAVLHFKNFSEAMLKVNGLSDELQGQTK